MAPGGRVVCQSNDVWYVATALRGKCLDRMNYAAARVVTLALGQEANAIVDGIRAKSDVA